MKRNFSLPVVLPVLSVMILGLFFSSCSETGSSEEITGLSGKEQAVIAMAALTAQGDLENLSAVINKGFDNGMTVNETGEVLLQMYAYTGFPRSLNAMGVMASVLEERKANGIDDALGNEPTPLDPEADKYIVGRDVLSGLMGFPLDVQKSESNGYSSAMDTFLKEHLFADIISRDNLSVGMRELATVGALCGLEGANPQLLFHMNAAMNVGISEDQMRDLTVVIGRELNDERGSNALEVLEQVLNKRNNPGE